MKNVSENKDEVYILHIICTVYEIQILYGECNYEIQKAMII